MKNTGFFHFSLADFGRARSRTGVFRTVFTVFFEGERHDLSKTGDFGRIMGPPPPGKPVTFYECHPDDHAPAPSVRADFLWNLYWGGSRSTKPYFFRLKWLQAAMKGSECGRFDVRLVPPLYFAFRE